MDLKFKLFLLVVSVIQYLDAATDTTTSTTPTTTTTNPTSTKKPDSTTAKAAIKCYNDSCTGQACSNTTHSSTDCVGGVCKTEIKNSTQYTFSCSSNVCTTDKISAPVGTEVFCCEQDNCNTYAAAQSSSTMLRGDNIAICVWLVFFLLKLF